MRKADEAHLSNLSEKFRPKAALYLQKANAWVYQEGWQYIGHGSVIGITDSIRDLELQAGRFSQGRVWNKNKGVWVVAREKDVVTRTMNSKHLRGEAIDSTAFSHTGVPFWPNVNDEDPDLARKAREFWEALAKIGEECGMRAGARFTKVVKGARVPAPDYPHFEDK